MVSFVMLRRVALLRTDVSEELSASFIRVTPDTSRTVINLTGVPLEEAACSALNKGLNYAVAPGRIPAKDFLCGVEKAIGTLPEETAEDIDRRRSGSSKALVSRWTTSMVPNGELCGS
jgi:hypothetical protein